MYNNTTISKSAVNSNFLSDIAISSLGEHNVKRFIEFQKLKDGWHFGKGKSLELDSLSTMNSFIDSYNSFSERCSLFLSEEGNLELV